VAVAFVVGAAAVAVAEEEEEDSVVEVDLVVDEVAEEDLEAEVR